MKQIKKSNTFEFVCVVARISLARARCYTPSRMSGQFSRLATLSHVLYDREVLELRQENERQRRLIEALEAKLEKKTNLQNATMRLMLLWTGNANRVAPEWTAVTEAPQY